MVEQRRLQEGATDIDVIIARLNRNVEVSEKHKQNYQHDAGHLYITLIRHIDFLSLHAKQVT